MISRGRVHVARILSRRGFSSTGIKFSPKDDVPSKEPSPAPKSSCPPQTVLTGLAWLKDQPPVQALPDEEYPPWLWNLLTPDVIPTSGELSKEQQRAQLRKENKAKIKATNFMKSR